MDCPTRREILEAVNGTQEPAALRDHLAACAACRAVHDGMKAAAEVLSTTPVAAGGGRCLSDSQLISYVRRSAPSGREEAVEGHLAGCAKCRSEAVDLADALGAEPEGEVPGDLERRILALVPRTRRAAGAARFQPKKAPAFAWAVAAAAVLFAAIVFLALPAGRPRVPVTKKRTEPPKAEQIVKEEPKVPEAPRREEAPKLVVEQPKPLPKPEPPKREAPTAELPKPPPKEEPRKPDPKPVVEAPPIKKEDPKPVPAPEPKTEVKVAKYLPVRVLQVNGAVARRGGGGALARGAELARADEAFTDHRHLSSFTLEGGVTVTLRESTAFRVERVEGGETRLTILSGGAFFRVDKRKEPFVVATPAAESIVVGTAFQVEMDEKRTALHVLEGTIRFRNEKGEVLVNAGQRSVARRAEKPSTPQRADVAAETAWTRRPDLAGDPKAELWMEHAQGANRKFPGLVVTAPYCDGEVHAGKLARALGESMDVGLLLGHNHRDREKKVWMNIDRTTEHDVNDDGTRGPAKVTPRAKKTFEEYMTHLRGAAGVAPRQPVPLVVCIRNHSYTVAGGELEICEVAVTGWDRKTIAELKTLYAGLLEKHKPAYRVEMRFEDVDATYPFKGQPQRFQFTESDAEGEGYLARPNSAAGIAFFFNPSSWKNQDDIEVYSKILAEMAEWLWLRRR